jgi:hypothetical protein
MANNSEREVSPLKRADTIRLTVEEWEACAKRLGRTSIPKPQRIISSFHRRSSLWSRDNHDKAAQERVKGDVLLGHSPGGLARYGKTRRQGRAPGNATVSRAVALRALPAGRSRVFGLRAGRTLMQ